MFKIFSDSACDLSAAYIKKYDIEIIPMLVSLDQKNYYQDTVEISRDEVYESMVNNSSLFPKTSLPPVDYMVSRFKKYTDNDIPLVMFTISTGLSGTYNAAMTARDIILEENPHANIVVIDSKANTVSQALVVDQMVRMRNDGLSFKQSLKLIDKILPTARIFFTVGSLDYLRKGGRIGKVAVKATSRIGIKPVIIMKDGNISLGGIGRNRKKLIESFINIAGKYLEENGKENVIMSVGYGYDSSEGASLMNQVEKQLGIKLNSDTNVAIGIASAVHTGPYAIGIGAIRNYKTLNISNPNNLK